ncbi:MAG TPA: YraN family protein [Streptosporangiaceae bacterium]|jgi:putative endonuclease|nr:YraN family protein [Streptosporangiaceae bacterium]
MDNPFSDPDAAITLAARYLESAGFRVLERTWRTGSGELGIAAADRHVFVACEVRTRSSTQPGTPAAMISKAGIRRLRRLAMAWINAHGMRFDRVRIDIITLIWDGPGGYTTEHLRGVG